MSYIGNPASSFGYTTTAYDHFNGDGATTVFTMSRSISANSDVEVIVNNVVQDPGVAYYVNGTTLTFTGAPSSGTNNIAVIYRQYVQTTLGVGANAISASSIAANTIQPYHLALGLLSPVVTVYTANGSTSTYGLTQSILSSNAATVTINGIIQNSPQNYSISANVITFTSAPANNSIVRILENSVIGTGVVPLDGTVTSSKFANNVTIPYPVIGGTLYTNSINSGTSNTLSILANNSTAVTVANTGYVGIGTSSPTNILTVNGGLELTSSSFAGSGSGFYLPASNNLGFVAGGTERMRLNNTGLGIGTTSPNSTLDSYYASTPIGATTYGTSATLRAGTGSLSLTGSNNRGIGTLVNTNQNTSTTLPYGGNYEVFGLLSVANAASGGSYGVYGVSAYSRSDGPAYAIRADAINTNAANPAYGLYVGSVTGGSSNYGIYVNDTSANNYIGGNLGLGVTPSAWGSQFKVIESGNGSTYQNSIAFQTNNNTVNLMGNSYYDGSNYKFKYGSGSATASQYVVNSNSFVWNLASGGTAGGTISSWTAAMTLDSSSRLLLNGTQTTGSSIYLQVNANGGNGATAGLGVFCNGSNLGNQYAYIYLANTNNYFYSSYDGNANARNQIAAVAGNSGGSTLSSGSTAWSTSSDSRLKNVTGTYTNALQDIAQLQPVKFTWKSDATNKPCVGVIAQSVQTVVPEAVEEFPCATGPDTTTEYLHVRYTELIPLMIASIQALTTEVTTLQSQVAALTPKA